MDAILYDTLLDAQIHPEYIRAGRDLFYAEFIATFAGKIRNGSYTVRPCPGSLELIESLKTRKDVLLGLLTGNHPKTAAMKLKAAGYDETDFPIGAFGQESCDRSLLVGLARDRAFRYAGQVFAPQEVVVLGDTARDITGARDAGVRNIAVATGTDDIEMLRAAKPDHLFATFEDTQAVLAAIFN
jgi:phosphoglycolate phosphatase-like HAD superfamily hydrolase